ncbi:MAG: translocase [Frondihabitans sp.]|nr:translocase [Frondihabitans sp.]
MFQSFDKLFVVAIIAVMLLGPTRLPVYAQKLAQLVKTVRAMADNARDRMKDEMGEEFADVDWQKLDPRQYDPRRIIRDALLEESPVAISTPASAEAAVAAGLPSSGQSSPIVPLVAGEAPPYDNEAT